MHKSNRFPIIYKYYSFFIIFIAYGWYKNGLIPVLNGFYPKTHLFLILLYPLTGFLIGFLIDKIFKNNFLFSNRFYGLLFSLFIPISTNIYLFSLILTIFLLLNTFFFSKIDTEFNFFILTKIIFSFLLFKLNQYNYLNLLEQTNLYTYSFLDTLIGHQISAIFTSNVLLILIAFLIFFFDYYYKKEIPLYSYGLYFLSLLILAIIKNDMNFLLQNIFSSTILFALVFLAPFSLYSPKTSKNKLIYSIIIGLSILPFSLIFSFYEGIYLSLIFASFIQVCLNLPKIAKKG